MDYIVNYVNDNNIEYPIYIDIDNFFLSNNSFIPNEEQFHFFC
ncbi:hypothetical protein BN938_2675 [Mucinivorans hirudinis]|uniref:Uncharacterized protein n=1 Tax=Mucinivorans hirudinis TaxID=1433126 RepID=A0A060REJ7_9BACT|nr:hypothetical protein BN938_2675 [Mucinivorans hirudinis]